MSDPIQVIFLGAGGHARVLAEAVELSADARVVGALAQESSSGLPLLGNDDDLKKMKARGIEAFAVAVGSSTVSDLRARLWRLAMEADLQPWPIIHPSAYFSPSASLGKGSQLMAGSIIQSGATLADNVIINSRALVEHDCTIASHVHIASGAVLCGAVEVGEGALIGAGSVIRQGIQIGSRALVAAGSTVVDDVEAGTRVRGVPARPF
jgi:sugar O-acyltransferase (sialic acid O-acetyltransferase NeuD family)